MKEILFRGKIRESGNWVEGWYCGQTNKSFFGEPVNRPQIIVKDDLGWAEVIPETVGQYTGLKDKNGTRIFEGDLIDIPNSKKRGLPAIVAYRERTGMFMLARGGYNDLNLVDVDTWGVVIGNVYDNPEYL